MPFSLVSSEGQVEKAKISCNVRDPEEDLDQEGEAVFVSESFNLKSCLALDYNQDLLNLLKDGNKKDYEDAFTNTAKKKQEINREHVFDSKRTFIKVANFNKRFPFDTQEPIFELCCAHPKSLTAKGIKMKDIEVHQDKCNCCGKPTREIRKL